MTVDTRKKILVAATKLFAAADGRVASLRAIAREADVNSALVHYHFGSREALFEAAILAALAPIQLRRQRLLAELRDLDSAPDVRDVARLFVEPLLPDPEEDPQHHANSLRLLARVFSEQRAMTRDLTLKHFGDSIYALGDFVGTVLSNMPQATQFRRTQFSVEVALESLASFETIELETNPSDSADRDEIVADLIDYLAGGLSAPVTT